MGRALVTGASGFTGHHLCRALIEAGYSVRALVRRSSRIEQLVSLGVDTVDGDLADPASIAGIATDIDRLFHVAALYRQEGVSRDLFHTVNVEGTRAMLEEAVRAGVGRFIHCSTVGVQGEIEDPPAKESAPYAPGDHYQVSKVEGEKLALDYHRNGKIDVVVVRPVGIYGPGDTRFLKLFRSIHKGRFRMIGNGEALYHLTYVEDLVKGMILAAETAAASGGVYTLGGNEYLPLNRLVSLIAEILKKPIPRRRVPLWPVYLAAVACETLCRPLGIEPPLYRRRLDFFTKDRAFDIGKARSELGYAPAVPLEEGLARTARWYAAEGMLD
jgi:nucleoside-diphosphate-sugar epimerase